MKPPIITFRNLVLNHADETHLTPVDVKLSQGENLVIAAPHQPELLTLMHACLRATNAPASGQIEITSNKHFKLLWLDWLDALDHAKYPFEHIVNYFLVHSEQTDATALLNMLDELKWTQYFNLPLSTLTPNLLICVKFILCAILCPQIICLSPTQAEVLKTNCAFSTLQQMAQQHHISLIILSNDVSWLKLLDNCQSLNLSLPSEITNSAEIPFTPDLKTEDCQTWQLYHEIKRHLNTPEFQASSAELQEKILTIYDQYQQQLNQIDPSLLHHSPDGSLTSVDWLQEQSQLTKMLLSETLTEDDLIPSVDERHVTSIFEPAKEDTQVFTPVSADTEIMETSKQTQPPTQNLDNQTTQQSIAEDTQVFTPVSADIEIMETSKQTQPLTRNLDNQTTQQSTVLIPPMDIDKIKKPKNPLLKDLFHFKRKK